MKSDDDDEIVKPDHSLLSMSLDDPRILAELEKRKARRHRLSRFFGIAIEIVVAGMIGGGAVLLVRAIGRLF